MARKTIMTLIDDIDGGDAERSVTFGLDGVDYEIDLNHTNINTLAMALGPFIKAARTVGRRRAPGGGAKGSNLAEVRTWAREQGFEVSGKGRVPTAVMTAYEQRS